MKLISFAAAVTCVLAAGSAAAVAVGDTVTCASSSFTCSTSSATVTNLAEFSLLSPGPVFSADFSANQLVVRYLGLTTVTFASGASFSFGDSTSPINAFELQSSSGVSNFNLTNLSLPGGQLTFAIGGATFASGSLLQLGLTSQSVASAPELASWAMMVAGLGAIGATMRRRKRVVSLA